MQIASSHNDPEKTSKLKTEKKIANALNKMDIIINLIRDYFISVV